MDDETARLNGGPSSSLSLDVELAASQTRRRHPDCVTLLAVGAIAGLLAAVAAALIAAAVIRPPLPGYRLSEQPLGPGSTELHTPDIVSRVAFGSCVAYDSATPQDVWTEGVLPSKPDAWLWLGDMAYMDVPPFDCNLEENAAAPACSCPPDHLKTPPFNCLAGDLDNARTKMQAQVRNANYTAFLDHMCPGAARAESPPQGDDPSACPKPILGIYDDHDSFSNNYDRRGPLKHLMKQVYLDGLGEAADSARRGALRGIEFHYRLNAG
jgi:alkaline phosphatase D